MSSFNRRSFLRSTAGGLAGLYLAPHLFAQESTPNHRAVPQPPFDSLFLTWQQDPTSTVTIQWVGPETGPPMGVRYVPFASDMWQPACAVAKPYQNTDLKVYRCELTGLCAGTDYKFQIGDEPTEYRFRTMPAKLTNEFSFVSGGDAGIGEHAVTSNIVAAKQDPFFVLMGGDLAYDNGRAPDTFLQFLRNYSRTMIDSKGRLIPMVSCIGNHEVDGGYNAPREKATSYLSLFDGFFTEKTFGVLDIGDYFSLVLLDSGHVAPITGEQTDWLARTLEDRQERSHLIAAHHVPCYPSYRNPQGIDGKHGTGEEQRIYWSPLFEEYRVDLVLEHHDHTFKRTHRLTDGMQDENGVLYLGDGSWGRLRVPKTPEERPYLAKVSSAYHVTLHRFEGNQRFHVALEGTGKVADVTTTFSKRPRA